MFTHLNCHSNYSFLAGANHIDALVRAAAKAGCSALALTDCNGLYGAVAFYRSAREAGIQPIFGAEIDGRENASSKTVLLAKNFQGFGEICRVISDRQLLSDFSLVDRLAQCSHDIILLNPDKEVVRQILNIRGTDDLFVELIRSSRQTRQQSRKSLAFATQHKLPVVASNRVFFIAPEDWAVHRLLSAIRCNTTIHHLPPGEVVAQNAWLKSPTDMALLFDDVPDAIRNTRVIAEQCQVQLPIGETLFPPCDLPVGETAGSHLTKLARVGLSKIYRHRIPAVAVRRLRDELAVIETLRFAPYFLIVRDIVREAKARNIPTVGRGSAANSLVCRALGITEVDPIAHNLYFERFLNPQRTDYPDIDIDFPWNRRDEILDYVFEKYGQKNVALISAHVHFRGRSALREAGKALGIPIREIDSFTQRLPHSIDLSRMEEARKNIPECRDLPMEDEPYRTMIELGSRIDGFPRHLSIHCGGIVICPFPITDRIPLQKTPKGFVVTQYDMYPVEDMGLLKIDLLAQKGLAVLADTVHDVATQYAKKIDFDRFDPVNDEKTRRMVRDGNTIGCFYIESPGMRNLLKKLRVETFEMLTAASSIIRPGIADSGMMKSFIDRHNGREPVHYLHPKLQSILQDTFGVMIYQEDVIKVANAIAGMSLGEADSLRKCMSKKRDWEDMNNYRDRFVSGARKNAIPLKIALEIWRQIESFAGYAFCKAHSASFALISYRTAWLKAHHPAEFMAAVLSNHGGFYDTRAYVEEARRMGITILPPHINHSGNAFTATRSPPTISSHTDADKPLCNAIRVGLSQVKQLTQNSIDSILKNRDRDGYHSLEDFLARVVIDECEVETLIRCGALDNLASSRPELLWQLKLAARHNLGTPHIKSIGLWSGVANRFGEECVPPLAKLADYSADEKLVADLECLDLTVSDHLLALYDDVKSKNRIDAHEMKRFAGRMVTLAGWLVNSKRTRTVKNEFMKFLMLEDRTASFEVTLFPKVYRQFGLLLRDRGPYVVRGRVEQDGLCFTVTADWLGRMTKTD
jgi:DNA-directed DNA polymerase III PolC